MGWWEIPANRNALRDYRNLAVPPRRVLDLGCGTGLALRGLAQSLPPASEIDAVDTSRGMLERSRKRLQDAGLLARVRFHRSHATRLDFAADSFDAAFSSFMLDMHDQGNRRAILKETARVCKDGAIAHWVVMDARPRSWFGRVMSRLYTRCYGHWNPVWMFFFKNYAPHCRPIDLEPDLAACQWKLLEKRHSYVTFFPVAIYKVQLERS